MNTTIYINGQQLELNENLAMAFTYSIADIREPDKRQTDYSKTITIPATKNNNKIFSSIFQIDKIITTTNYSINFAPDFNPAIKADIVLYIDDIEVFKGYLQLLKINLLNKQADTYEVVLYGSLANIFKELGESKLGNLDLSEYDHAWTRTNITESWATRIQKNGANYNNFVAGNPIGEGYVYPLIDYGNNNGITYKVTDLFPAVYAKTYIDKIFNYAGFTYTSTFFNSQLFKNLIIPFNKKALTLSNADVKERTFRVEFPDLDQYPNNTPYFMVGFGDTAPTTTLTTLVKYQTDIDDVNDLYITDKYSIYYGQYICNKTGDYDLIYYLDNDFYIDIQDKVDSIKASSGGGTVNYYFRFSRYNSQSNTTTVLDSTPTQTIDFSTIFTSPTNYPANISQTLSKTINNVSLHANDRVYVEMVMTSNAPYIKDTNNNLKVFTFGVRFTPESYHYNQPVGFSLQEGDTIPLNEAIPNGILQKDFLISIVKMFNLYLYVDKINDKNIIVEQREDFYNTDYVDWTYKVDQSKDFEIIPIGELDTKTFNFSYKDDSDHYNTKYKNLWNETYGNAKYEVVNDFINGVKDTNLIFSPTPAIGSTMNDRLVPCFIDYDSTQLNNNMTDTIVKKPKDVNIRILHYSGLKSTAISFGISSISAGNTIQYTSYPFANHIDDRTTPTLDLNFGAPVELYYTTGIYTNNNLFNKYWSRLLNTISDHNSKIVTCYVLLKPKDILTLDFRKLYLIDGNYFRLNKIIDYDPLAKTPTKCELLKIKDASAFTGTSIRVIPNVTSFNYIEGSSDEVQNLFGASIYNFIEGGQDEVRDLGATSSVNLINGGLNAV